MTDVRPAFVFLREDGEPAGDRVARCAEQALAAGPMANTVRGDDYEAFLSAAYGDGKTARTIATSCAVFAGACCILAEVQKPRGIPKARAITTWLGVRGFIEDDEATEDVIEGAWIPLADLDAPKRGDVFYICSTAGSIGKKGTPSYYAWTRWEAAANGHVGIVLDGGFVTKTAEGGGSPGGTGCRMSLAPKDIRALGRTLRGVWRPESMARGAGLT